MNLIDSNYHCKEWVDLISTGRKKKCCNLKDTDREKVPSNKTPELTESMNMDIWEAGTSNQLLYQKRFSKKIK